ncbi:MAG: hypothetical protein Q7I93_03910 [Syntrophales bacterium]|nr:hypothetical protein [Syntrophales bacterium]
MKEDKSKEKTEEDEATEGSRGVAESVLDGLGNLIPGLGGLIKGLKTSEAFREKLASIDEEVERRLEETPLKRTDSEISGGLTRHPSRPPSGIPPSVARRGTRSRKHFDTFTAGHDPMDKGERDIPVDIFEEEKKIRVIAELPGVNEEDIRLDLNEDILVIFANRGNHNYRKDIKLPRTFESITGKTYNNGILEVTLG